MTTDRPVERRIVTVLFADLVGFTPLSERLDAEDVAIIQDAYFATVRETIARYGGVLEKFIGDAVMAVFGVPRARDDDAERAVRAGLALVAAVEGLGARLARDDVVLRLRVGVNSGEVVTTEAGPDQGRVTGDTVNVAARFQAAAAPGDVLMGEGTALAVADAVESEPLGGIELKGKATPVPAWRVAALRPLRSREAAMGRLRAPMLGRAAESAALRAAADRTAAGATSERWVVVAPPGTGKSRLLGEFAAMARGAPGDHAVWAARLRADVLAPYDGVAQLLAAALEDEGADPRDAADTYRLLVDRSRAAGASSERADVVANEAMAVLHPPSAGAEAGHRAADDRAVAFDAWCEGLDALAGQRQSIWLVEDVHWAGADLLAFLDAAGRRPRSGGRLVVTTARPSLLELAPAWCSSDVDADPDAAHLIHLEPLTPADASGLVRALVPDALPDALVAEIAGRADGNPLFIEELLRTWIAVGTLRPEGAGFRLALDPGTVQLPATVQAIYAAQIDDLPPDARAVARRASVAGRRFPTGALPALDVDGGEDGVDALARRAFVSGPIPDPLTGPAFSYRHALLRDAGYASLARAERARLHVAMARWLEGIAAERADEVAEGIAGHYASAIESAPALSMDVVDGLDRAQAAKTAAAWFERGAARAVSVAGQEGARTLLRRAIDLTPGGEVLAAARRWLRLGEATAFSADMDEGRDHVQRSLELYRSVWQDRASPVDDREAARGGMADASWTLGVIAWQQVRFLECRDLARRVLDEVGRREDLATARLLIQWARGHYGETDEVEPPTRELERALGIAERLADERLILEAREALQLIRREHGDSRLEPWLEIGALAERRGDWTRVVRALSMPASLMADDRAAEARAYDERAGRVAEAHGLTEQVGWSDYRQSEFALVTGEWDDVLTHGLRALELARRNAYRRLGVRTWFTVLVVAAQRGDRGLGERCRADFDALEGRQPDSPYARVMLGGTDLFLGDLGIAENVPPPVEPRVPAYTDTPMGLASFCAATERLFEAWLDHDRAGARSILPVIVASAAMPTGTELARATASLLRARLALADGGAANEAGEAASEALRRSRGIHAPWWIAKSIRALAATGRAEPDLMREAETIERGLRIRAAPWPPAPKVRSRAAGS